MLKKTIKFSGVALILLALAALALPIFSTTLTDGETAEIVIRGYNLARLSPFGSVVLLAPILTLGIVLSKFKTKLKTAALLGVCLLNGVSLSASFSAADGWIRGIADGYVYLHSGCTVYATLSFAALVCFYILYNFLEHKQTLNSLIWNESLFETYEN